MLAAPDGVTFDSVSHDFGSQPKNVGSLEHVFKFTNNSTRAVKVSYALATCSCTSLSWSKDMVAPGAEGFVKATYFQERNADSFEKFISVFFDGSPKPTVLRIAGSFYETSDVLASEFPVVRGPVGFMFDPVKYGQALLGSTASDSFWVANLSSEPARLDFTDLSDSLDIYPKGIVVQPMSRQRFSYFIQVDSSVWGLRRFDATPLIAGTAYDPVSFTVVAVEDYSSLSASERNSAPRPILVDRDCSFGTVRTGRPANAVFRVRNSSQDAPLQIRAAYCEEGGIEIAAPSEIAPGQTEAFSVSLAPSVLARGHNSIKVYVLSNSPLRQILEVFVSGNVE